MKVNGTGTGGGLEFSPQDIIALVAGGTGILGSLCTFAYFRFKSQFSDKQDTDVKLSTTFGLDGSTKIDLEIFLKNDESYSTSYKTGANGEAAKNDDGGNGLWSNISGLFTSKENEGAPTPLTPNKNNTPYNPQTNNNMMGVVQQNLDSVLNNNRYGDKVIEDTRNHTTRDAYNAYLKAVKLHLLSLIARQGAGEYHKNLILLQYLNDVSDVHSVAPKNVFSEEKNDEGSTTPNYKTKGIKNIAVKGSADKKVSIGKSAENNNDTIINFNTKVPEGDNAPTARILVTDLTAQRGNEQELIGNNDTKIDFGTSDAHDI